MDVNEKVITKNHELESYRTPNEETLRQTILLLYTQDVGTQIKIYNNISDILKLNKVGYLGKWLSVLDFMVLAPGQ